MVCGEAFPLPRLPCVSCAMCELRMMEVMSSGKSADVENEEHNVVNLSLEVVAQGRSGMLIDCFPEDWELARVALSCRLALGLFCQEMKDSLSCV